MLEVIKFVNIKVKDNLKRLFNEKFENFDISVNESVKNVFGKKIKGFNEIVKKVIKKLSVLKVG